MNYKQAKIADSAKVAKETVLVGNITIGEESTVLFFTACLLYTSPSPRD